MRRNLLPQLSPLVLGDACGHLSGAAGSTLEGDQGFPVSPAAGSLQANCSAAPADLGLTGALSSPVREASARGRPCSVVKLLGDWALRECYFV